MATIGLDKLFYAPITEAANGDETYGTPVQLVLKISKDSSDHQDTGGETWSSE